jgi:hypothetical protein
MWGIVQSLNSWFEILCTCALLYTTKKKHKHTHSLIHTDTHIHTLTDTYWHWYIQTLIHTDTDIYRHWYIQTLTDTYWHSLIHTDRHLNWKNLILIDALEYTSNDTYRQAYRQIPECGKKSLFDLCFIIYRYLLLNTLLYYMIYRYIKFVKMMKGDYKRTDNYENQCISQKLF